MTAIGIDVGGTTIKGLKYSPGDSVEIAQVRQLPENPHLLAGTLVDMIGELGKAGTEPVGIGVAGLVAWPEGRFLWGPHVEGIDLPLRSSVEEVIGRPVIVDNDANCAALAELRLGNARRRENVVVITVGTGIGGGLIVDGKIYRGGGLAGEIGHMVVDPDGEKCACGGRGCWETLVSGNLLDRQAQALLGSQARGQQLTEAASAGEPAARSVMTEMGRWLGRGVANLVAILDPELVLVGGAASSAGEWLLEPARRELDVVVEGAGHRPPAPLVGAAFSREGAALGAALEAIEVLGGNNG